MAKRAIQKSIRLNSKTLKSIETFMESARVMSAEEEKGKKTISNNLTKAFHYLVRAYFESRQFIDRALFDGTLRDLESLTTRLIKTGNDLNNLNKARFSGASTNIEPGAVLNELSALFDQNERLLNLLNDSFILSEDGRT